MLQDREIDILIEEIYKYHGYDFSGYAAASFCRRIERLYQMDRFEDFTSFLSKARSDELYFKHMIEEITVNVTEMFRDPSFYKILRTEILPALATKPFIRIWHAGCATGEEVFSVAILLKELNLLEKSLLYGTDLNPAVLEIAKKGVFPLRCIQQYAENYRIASGKSDFSEYYTANYGYAKFSNELISKMVFSQHNLIADGSFNEFDVILCRNVLIYFDKDFQRIALELFDQSLSTQGFLALGSKETLKFSSIQHRFRQFKKEKIWKKMI
jgi:chemotaxis protein methyltransferase CheR